MTSPDFLLCYASVTTALFDQIEHDMLALASAFIDDDEAPATLSCEVLPSYCPQPMGISMT
ncbi:hypothetical protein LQ564_06255 [Massilia sp. G4R7]|uniref:Uncharacterized protein n=1 Tax=Massilia phyllostachyos TaxID=2898585 RepID=A0ABS8Q2F0_9BURK|nr:hypothetical protein [Massilia phyllostachyos]MCD2515918.1 hypothetical protein [Massilia phyllostachyos]